MTDATTCPRCGTSATATSRFCSSCGASMAPDISGPTVAAAVARGDRLSDSGALQLKELLVELVAGEYEVFDELGRGGMAVVYKATEVHLKRTVAIKVLPPDLTYAKGATERFRREAQTAAALDHPNIIPIYRISSGGRLFWYAMKFLEGRSLGDILQEKGLLTVAETVAILDQVAAALDWAHEQGVVHRDVKPGNVMIDSRGRVTVTDFGIAKELQNNGLTGSGAIIGTPYYMSPEQCRGGQNLTGAADQYSLGVVAYQMLTGQLPFEADSAIDVIHKHVSEPPPPIEALLPGLPRHVINAVNRAMAKKAADRFPTVTAFVNAMKNLSPEATLIVNRRPSTMMPRTAPRQRRALLWTVVTALAVFAAASAALVAGARRAGTAATTAADSALVVSADSSGSLGRGIGAPGDSAGPGERGTVGPGDSAAVALPDSAEVTRPASARRNTTTARPGTIRAESRRTTVPLPAAAAGKGFLRISVTNSWADITVAGRTVPQRRVWSDSLAPGTYQVTFARDGWRTETRSVTVRAGQEAALRVTLQQQGQQ